MTAYLTFSVQGQERRFTCGSVLNVGRDYSSDLVLESKKVSRNHACIRQLGNGEYYVMDCGSANGTYVNGRRILVPTVLKNGDSVSFGSFHTIFVSGKKPLLPYSIHDSLEDYTAVAVQKTRAIPITLLVAQIRGFSELSNSIPIQRCTELVRDWVELLTDCVQGYRGTMDKFDGDSVFARWKHDTGTDHSIIRALYTACCIQQVPHSLREKHPDLIYPLRVSVAVNNGQMDTNVGQGSTVHGDIMDPAFFQENESKLQQKDILISKSAYQNLPPRFWSGREHKIYGNGNQEPVCVVGYTFSELPDIL